MRQNVTTHSSEDVVTPLVTQRYQIPFSQLLSNSWEWDSNPTWMRCSAVANQVWLSGETQQQKYSLNMSLHHFLNIKFRNYFKSFCISSLQFTKLFIEIVACQLSGIQKTFPVPTLLYNIVNGLRRISLHPLFKEKSCK